MIHIVPFPLGKVLDNFPQLWGQLTTTKEYWGAGMAASGEGARLLPLWPGFDSGQVPHIMYAWVDFVVVVTRK